MKYKYLILLILIVGVSLIGFTQNAPRNVKFSVGQSVYELPASTKINGEIDWHFVDSVTTCKLIRKAIDDVEQFGNARNKKEALHIQSERILQSVLNNSEQKPDIALYFGCAGWNSDQSNQYDVIKKLIPNITLFGRFNGGEIGRFVNNDQNQAGIDLLSVLLLYNT